MNFPGKLVQKKGQMVNDDSLELFRRILVKNIQPYIGKNDPEKSPAIAAGLVTQNGDVTVALGHSDINNNKEPDGETLFAIGSISKVFTGLILAQAVSDGDLVLSEKANNLLGENIQIDEHITLKHLVSHFSGLPNFPDNIARSNRMPVNQQTSKLMPAKNYSQVNLEKCLQNNNCSSQTQPGEKYLYSNLGIGVLSIALQNNYEYQDFNSLCQAKITKVLGMQKTSTNSPGFLHKHSRNLAKGYQYQSSSNSLISVPFSSMGILAGSGELISNVNDMATFLKLLTDLSNTNLKKGARELEQELGGTDIDGLTTAYAHKIRLAQDGGKIHFKTGLTAGYSAVLIWRDNPKVGVILLSNKGRFRPLLAISNRVMGIITQQLLNN